jgi:hypothetical protein
MTFKVPGHKFQDLPHESRQVARVAERYGKTKVSMVIGDTYEIDGMFKLILE